MTEAEARAALCAFVGVGDLERWIAEQRWEAIPGGWRVRERLNSWRFRVEPAPQTRSPRPPGVADTPARQRPEGNTASGAAMSGAQQGSAGAAATGGAPPPRSPSTTSPQPSGSGAPSR